MSSFLCKILRLVLGFYGQIKDVNFSQEDKQAQRMRFPCENEDSSCPPAGSSIVKYSSILKWN